MNRWVRNAILCMACLLICCASSFALAEYEDYSKNFYSYAQAVAEMSAVTDGSIQGMSVENASPLVMLKTNGSEPDLAGFEPVRVIRGSRNRFVALFENGETAAACVRALERQSGIVYAEQDGQLEACMGSTDPISMLSWGAGTMGFGKLAAFAADEGTGRQMVAVIDSGIYSEHSMLSSRVTKLGYDYVDQDWDPTNDEFSHGTHVAGIIADSTRGLPINMMAIRVLNKYGSGSIANLVSAIDEAVLADVDVINISISAKMHNTALVESIRNALNHGITVVIAAGNNHMDTCDVCPAHMLEKGVIIVGSLAGSADMPYQPYYTNYGDSVDVSAFGTMIYSCSSSGGYETKTGTSMAAPHIAAAVAVLRLLDESIGPAEAERILQTLCTAPVESLPGYPIVSNLVPKSITLNADALSLSAGTTLRIDAELLPAVSPYEVEWSSSDGSVAQMSADGTLTCSGAGSAVITAAAAGGVSHAIDLTVTESGQAFVLPSAMREVCDCAFEGAHALKICVLPEGTESIGSCAFRGSGLKTIVIPDSVTYIDTEAFSGTEDTVLLCGEDSYAQWFAEDYGYSYFIISEISMSGQ